MADMRLIYPKEESKRRIKGKVTHALDVLPLEDGQRQRISDMLFSVIDNSAEGWDWFVDSAQIAESKGDIKGGIDLTQGGMTWSFKKDGPGVEMNVNPALIERIRREGIHSLTPFILRVSDMPVINIWPLLGLEPPKRQDFSASLRDAEKRQERLAGA